MVVIFGEDANQVDMEVYRLRDASEEVKGAHDVRTLRYALQGAKAGAITVRILPSKWELHGREFTLFNLPAQAVDVCMEELGS